MGQQPFDREVWNSREKPLSSDNNFGQQYADRTARALMKRLMAGRFLGMNGVVE